MSKSFRRRRFFASFREVALILLLSATFVGFVGCAGGSNPFCCDSKEKNKIDQNLERAQSLDENEKNARSSEESKKSEEIKENDEDDEETIHAIILKTDGSGNAPQIADAAAQTVAQEVPVTVSPSDANELLQAPVLPSTTSTGLTATAAPSDVATADSNETSAQTDATA
ncbi:MAG: hypothetical protein IJE77_11910, partial [Thermoguttaceae bacterium]|nr:hypothetical protein [Thermoguttaceae bacterium]